MFFDFISVLKKSGNGLNLTIKAIKKVVPGMEEQNVKLNQECRVIEVRQGSFIYFDNTGLEAPQSSNYQEYQKELQRVIRRGAGVSHANLLKYITFEKYEGKIHLGREDSSVRNFRQWEPLSLADTCRVLLIMKVNHDEIFNQGIFMVSGVDASVKRFCPQSSRYR